jgi:hypothetical protein
MSSEHKVLRVLVWGEKISTTTREGKEPEILIERTHETYFSSSLHHEGANQVIPPRVAEAIALTRKELNAL